MECSPKKDFDSGNFKPSRGYIVNHYPGDIDFLLDKIDALSAQVAVLKAVPAEGPDHS